MEIADVDEDHLDTPHSTQEETDDHEHIDEGHMPLHGRRDFIAPGDILIHGDGIISQIGHTQHRHDIHCQIDDFLQEIREQILQDPHPKHIFHPDGIGKGDEHAPDPHEPAEFLGPGQGAHAGDFPDDDLQHAHTGNQHQHNDQECFLHVFIQPM